MAIEKIIDVKIQSEGAEQAVKSLRTQFREAQQEVAELSAKFGATSKEAVEAAKSASQLKDQIGDARALTDAFNPDAKFKSLTSSLSGVAGGFSAVQGAMGLVGAQSEDVEKTLLKVQSAMALSTGLQQLGESADAFKQLKAVAINALNGIKTAIGSTGIGLLVIALGAIYAYWDDIKEVVSGVSDEQKKLNEQSEKNLQASQKKLDNFSLQENSLRLQGKSEKEILQMKINQTSETIRDAKIRLENSIATAKAQEATARRNQEILAGALKFLNIPLTLLLKTVDYVGKALGKDFGLEDKFLNSVSKFVFDPEKTKAEGNKVIEEQQKALAKLESDKQGMQLSIKNIDKKASDDAKQIADEKAKKNEETLKKEADDLKSQKDALKSIEEKHAKSLEDLNAKTDREKLELQKKRDLEELDNVKLSEEEKAKARLEILEKYKILGKELDQKDAEEITQKELEDKEKEFENQSLSFEERRELLDEQSKIIDEGFFKSEEERTNSKNANTKARTELDKLESESKQKQLSDIGNALSQISTIAGESTTAGKALAVASTAISTYQSAQQAYASQLIPGDPSSPIRASIFAGIAVAGGLMNIKKILAVKTPSGSGSGVSAPSISASSGGGGTTSAPQFNVVGNSGTNQLASTLGNAMQQNPVQAYVVASNVTTAQSLNRNIVQNATLG
jgi:chromosome segregation ATPase